MKTVKYNSLNQKNKNRVDSAIALFEVKPTMVHHTITTTGCTKFVSSMVTVSNPAAELLMLVGGRQVVTKITIDS